MKRLEKILDTWAGIVMITDVIAIMVMFIDAFFSIHALPYFIFVIANSFSYVVFAIIIGDLKDKYRSRH